MDRRGLGAVIAPRVIPELLTPKVLATEWVDGTRLDRDASPDVPRLCAVAINAYMTMLLDTGVLHCDPHPGNLLRTTDGRLCILDWGMTLGVPTDLQYSLIEFIAHVNAEDYDAMPQDFVNLQFSPPDQLNRLRQSNLTEGLSFVLRQLSQGGGGKKIQARVREEWRGRYGDNLSPEELREKVRAEMKAKMEAQLEAEGVDISTVSNVMEEMAARNREMFKVPPYVLYLARAFSTLEGIGLSSNDDYSIVQEAFPYLSQRLLTDDSPRARAALKSMVYGAQPSLAGVATEGTTPLKKLLEISDGFANYTTATSDAQQGGPADGAGSAKAAEELVERLISPDGGCDPNPRRGHAHASPRANEPEPACPSQVRAGGAH